MSSLTKKGFFWAMVPVALLATTAVSVLVVVSIALDDPGFSVEKDYYKKASRFDSEQQQRKKNSELGWQLGSELTVTGKTGSLLVTLRDRDGKPITGASLSAEAFAVSRGKEPLQVRLSETTPGTYQATLQSGRPGLWEVRVLAERGADRFTAVEKQDALVAGVGLTPQGPANTLSPSTPPS